MRTCSRIVLFAQDPHPRVRHALCNCIGQLCYDFVPRLQKVYANVVMPCLLSLLQDVNNPRYGVAATIGLRPTSPLPYVCAPAHLLSFASVWIGGRPRTGRSVHAHAAAAIINFVTYNDDSYDDEDDAGDDADGEDASSSPVARAFAPYMDVTLQAVRDTGRAHACSVSRTGSRALRDVGRSAHAPPPPHQLMGLMGSAQKRYVLEQCVDTLAAIAEVAGAGFRQVRLCPSARRRRALGLTKRPCRSDFDGLWRMAFQHYAKFMPVLENLLMNARGVQDRLLRGKVIECITLIGAACATASSVHVHMRVRARTHVLTNDPRSCP